MPVPLKLTRSQLERVVRQPEFREVLMAHFEGLDICDLQSEKTALPDAARKCARDKVLTALNTALARGLLSSVIVERRKRCGTHGRDGLWVELPEPVLDALMKDIAKCLPKNPDEGAPPPKLPTIVLT